MLAYSRHEQEKITKKVKKYLSPKRYEHTLRVAEVAVELANIHEEDSSKAYIAAILHDCAKNIPNDKKIKMAEDYKLILSDYEKKNTDLIHAKLGKYMAMDLFQIYDEEILSAIAKHTTGDVVMSKLDQIIYIADYIEPGRKVRPGLEEARATSMVDLNKTMLIILDSTVHYLKDKAKSMDQITIETYHFYQDLLEIEA